MKKAGKITEDKIVDQLSLIKGELADYKSSIRSQEFATRLSRDDIAIIKQEQRELAKKAEALERGQQSLAEKTEGIEVKIEDLNKIVKGEVMGSFEKILGELRKVQNEIKVDLTP